MAFSGGGVAVLVAGRAVGVSVGGMDVADGGTVGLGGTSVGKLVIVIDVPAALQAASARVMRLNQNHKEIFFTIFSCFMVPPPARESSNESRHPWYSPVPSRCLPLLLPSRSFR